MVTDDAEAVRRNLLTGFIPGSGLPIFDPPPPDEAWDAVEAEGTAYPRLSLEFWTSKQRRRISTRFPTAPATSPSCRATSSSA
jgi:hypothetical protein